MALSHPLDDEPEDDAPKEEFERLVPRQRPDWLTDADAGARDEAALVEGGGTDLPRPRLLSHQPEAAGPAPATPEKPAGPTPWIAAASSIPTLRVLQAAPPRVAAPSREAPPDEAAQEAFLEDAEPGLQEAAAPGVPRRALAPLEEPWWVVAADALRHDGRLQALVGAAVVALLAFLLWPRSSPDVSLATIHRHPERYDGSAVSVHGRVGDVFRMGGGYTFYLQQGRESLVVFTRSRVPVSGQRISVKGTISTGYLDGAPRQTLFEATP